MQKGSSKSASLFNFVVDYCSVARRKGVVLPGAKLLLPESIADGIETSGTELLMRLACGMSEEFTGVSPLASETRF